LPAVAAVNAEKHSLDTAAVGASQKQIAGLRRKNYRQKS